MTVVSITVSPDGAGNGHSSPCSLDAVPGAIRRARADGPADVDVVLAGGVYERREPLAFTSDDLGDAGGRVVVRSEDGERVVLSGGATASGFRLHDSTRNIWVTQLDGVPPFENLWSATGTRLQRAWSGFHHPMLHQTRRGITVRDGLGIRAPDFRNPGDVVMVGRHFWYYVAGHPSTTTGSEFIWDPEVKAALGNPPLTIGVIGRVGYYGSAFLRTEKRFALENTYEFLDTPGEWYFDRHTNELFVCPTDDMGEDFSVIYPKVRSFIRLEGTVDRHIEHVEISGLHFRYNDGDTVHATAAWPTEPTVLSTPPPESAVQINAGSHITIQGCSFQHIGNEALHFDLAGHDCVVEGNAFDDISGTALAISQSNLALPTGHGFTEIDERNRPKIFRDFVVSNNYLRRTVTNPIRMAHAISYSEFIHGLRVVHNDIADTAGHAIRNSWRYGGFKGGHTGGIDYGWNRVAEVGRAGFSDYGALYIACANNGEPNVIHHNFVDGIGDPEQDNIGIYLDAHVTHGEIHENVLLNLGKKHSPFGNHWVGFVASRGNSAHHNWVHGNRSVQDVYLPSFFEYLGLRRLFLGRRNNVYDNTHWDEIPANLPAQAQDVIDHSGLQPEFSHLPDLLTETP